jgi:superfamily I DNA and RNA helicase
MEGWKRQLFDAVRDSTDRGFEITGYQTVDRPGVARVATSLLRTYGQSSAGLLYVEAYLAHHLNRAADIVLMHHDLGVAVIEVKNHTIDGIHRVVAGEIRVWYQGRMHSENALHQVEKAMYRMKRKIQDVLAGDFGPVAAPPFFIYPLLAFPNISRDEWCRNYYDESISPDHLLLADDLLSDDWKPRVLKRKMETIVKYWRGEAGFFERPTSPVIVAVQKAFGDSAVLRATRGPRPTPVPRSLGDYIDQLAIEERYLTEEQQDLSRMSFDGHPQLVRGVAGSGKTIVLANNVAHWILRNCHGVPDGQRPRIAVVCFNRALVEFIRSKIRESYFHLTQQEIPKQILTVTHSNGLLRNYVCAASEGWIKYTHYDVSEGLRVKHYLPQVVDLRRKHPQLANQILWDALYIDEGQDFVADEFHLMYELVKDHPETGERTFVVFYDDAQNVYGRRRPDWRADTGIDFSSRKRRSFVMKDCHRNTKEIIEFAYNVLLGSATPSDRRVRTRMFADVGYLKDARLVTEDEDGWVHVRFARGRGDLPEIKTHANIQAELDWAVREIDRLINRERVRPEDLLILFPQRHRYDKLHEMIRQVCPGMKFIRPHTQRDKNKYIIKTGHLTVSTIHSAKGYDSYLVFLLGIDLLKDTPEQRAVFYVGATRAKLRLWVSGVRGDAPLLREAYKVLRALPNKLDAPS